MATSKGDDTVQNPSDTSPTSGSTTRRKASTSRIKGARRKSATTLPNKRARTSKKTALKSTPETQPKATRKTSASKTRKKPATRKAIASKKRATTKRAAASKPRAGNEAQAGTDRAAAARPTGVASTRSMIDDLATIARLNSTLLFKTLSSPPDPRKLRADPLNIMPAFAELGLRMATQPSRVLGAQARLAAGYARLVGHAARRVLGMESERVAQAPRGDRRFRAEAWNDKLAFDLMKQAYLLASASAQDLINDIAGSDPQTREKWRFFTRQLMDAGAPSNFILTNPEVLEQIRATRGANLIHGLRTFLEDLDAGGGKLQTRMTRDNMFEVGVNLATTPGKVVFQNDMMQLIQYAPTTSQVHARPLLIIPPWINKFYILDLKPENSFIRWAVAQGYTLFVISWVNPDERHATKVFDDYMSDGIMPALDAIAQATGQRDVNTIGYCIGGTLLAATLAYMAKTGDKRIRSATFFTSQVDFSEAGELKVFIDDKQLDNLDRMMEEKGYLDGRTMATTFNMLRANDLIWVFFVNNYLLGKEPPPFDLLYWNCDSTRMPRAMHMYYLREMYLHNRLVEPGALKMKGVPIDLREVKIPVYLQSSREDHIAPYPSVYKATRHFSGDTRFMMAGSGHIAGVVNPPSANKYQHWTNDAVPDTVEEWIAGAQEHPGSWWPDWDRWLARRSGKKVTARQPGDGKLTPIEDAPGSYVKN